MASAWRDSQTSCISAALNAKTVLHLQRSAGNAAVQWAIQRCGAMPASRCPCHGKEDQHLRPAPDPGRETEKPSSPAWAARATRFASSSLTSSVKPTPCNVKCSHSKGTKSRLGTSRRGDQGIADRPAPADARRPPLKSQKTMCRAGAQPANPAATANDPAFLPSTCGRHQGSSIPFTGPGT